jgi:hypothetical protein
MHLLIRFVIAFIAFLVFLFLSLLATTAINIWIYGGQQFEGNAGAKFAVFVEWVVVAFPLAMVIFFVTFHLTSRIRRLRAKPR